MSISAWGKLDGISREAARKRVRDHGIPLHGGMVDADEADAIWRASQNPAQAAKARIAQRVMSHRPAAAAAQPQLNPPISGLAAAQLKKLLIELQIKQLALEHQKGTLVARAEVESAVAEMIVNVRAKLLSIGSELRDRVAQTSDPAACQRLIDGRIHEALNSLAELKLSGE